MGKLKGKIAVITGGNSGIGLATAKRFVEEGAFVFITGRRQDELDKAVKEIGENAAAIQSDVTKLDDLDRLFETIKNEKGRVDVLFANAGRADIGALDQVSEQDYMEMFDLNVKGALFTVQKALPLIPEGGSIVLNGSMLTVKGLPKLGLTAAAKSAVRSFARTWAAELKGRKIRVNTVSPGTVITPGYKTQLGMTDEQIDYVKAQAASHAPAGRDGSTDEIAKAVLFLASDDSSYVNGAELFVDGGTAQV
jgi:NAD(P)-dependent dehydrogenase (short-subunit alcohol dehydrogenase family)